MSKQEQMDAPIDAKERCAACGLPRDAHWGPRPICAGVCTGFQSSETAVLEDARQLLGKMQGMGLTLETMVRMERVVGALEEAAAKGGAQ